MYKMYTQNFNLQRQTSYGKRASHPPFHIHCNICNRVLHLPYIHDVTNCQEKVLLTASPVANKKINSTFDHDTDFLTIPDIQEIPYDSPFS